MNGDHEETRLEGKVAQILNEREIAITIGKKHGVAKGMRFAVLAATPQEIRDPDTNEVLDTLDREKVEVEATDVRDRITVCSTFRTTYIPGGLFSQPMLSTIVLQNAFAPPREMPETLRIQDSSLPAPLDPEESFVKIGDRVREIAVPSTQTSREVSARR